MNNKPIETMLSSIDWKPTVRDEIAPSGDSDLPYATHEGELEIMGGRIKCYRLNTGEAILDADDVNRFFGFDIK